MIPITSVAGRHDAVPQDLRRQCGISHGLKENCKPGFTTGLYSSREPSSGKRGAY